jgi:hypothetical protein
MGMVTSSSASLSTAAASAAGGVSEIGLLIRASSAMVVARSRVTVASTTIEHSPTLPVKPIAM